MRTAAQLVKQARQLAGYTRAELARASDVAASTIGRIEAGDVDPSWTVLSKVLAAAGFKLGDTLQSLGDVSAIEAAANALTNAPAQRDDRWTRSWAQAGLLDDLGRAKDAARVAAIAGLASELPARAGTRRYALDRPVDQVLELLTEIGANPVATSVAAFGDIDPGGVAVYVDDPSTLPFAEAKPYSPVLTALKKPMQMLLSPGDSLTNSRWALVDAYASGGRIADRADAYAARVMADA